MAGTTTFRIKKTAISVGMPNKATVFKCTAPLKYCVVAPTKLDIPTTKRE